MDSNSIRHILDKSLVLSRPYWQHYERLIGPTRFVTMQLSSGGKQCYRSGYLEEKYSFISDINLSDENDKSEDADNNNLEYLEFIKVTREHQMNRDKLKQLKLKRNSAIDDKYYKDISQVDTLTEDNLVEVPDKVEWRKGKKLREEILAEMYGEKYDKIRSLEMNIDEHFNQKCQELCPQYWPVMPINPKPYLNHIDFSKPDKTS